jgi:hypothetical protein
MATINRILTNWTHLLTCYSPKYLFARRTYRELSSAILVHVYLLTNEVENLI